MRLRAAAAVAVVLAGLALTAALTVPGRSGSRATVLWKSPLDESLPAADGRWVAWTEGGLRGPGAVWARDGTARPYRIRLPAGERGFSGAVSGGVLALQVFRDGGADIALYDLAARRFLPAPLAEAAGGYRSQPALAGRNLAFVESTSFAPVLVAVDLATGARRIVRQARGSTRLVNGQAAGDWLVFVQTGDRLRHTGAVIGRYRFSRRTIDYVHARPGERVYAPAVTDDGTVYYAVARSGCGGVDLVRARGDGAQRVASVGGKAVGSLAAVAAGGGVDLYYDAWPVDGRCRPSGDSDVYRVHVAR